jgi:cardiolipin synthase A/B
MSLIRSKKKSRFPESMKFFNRFRRSTEANFSRGNSLVLLKKGEDFFNELYAAIGQAEQSVYLEFYIVRADVTGKRLAELLAHAVERGVEVCLLYDYVGCFDTPASFFRSLESKGVNCVPFNPPPFKNGLSWFDKRDHRKIAIIDNRVGFAGGMNIGDEYAGVSPSLYWRDVGVRIEGSSVNELGRLFCESWLSETSSIPPGSCNAGPAAGPGIDEVAIVSGGPHHNRSRIRAAFRMAIAGATESVRIQTPYFVPGPRFIRALLRSVKRGAQVQLIFPAKIDVKLVGLVNRSSYATLLKGGIEVYERGGTMLHGKVMLIDGRWSVIGSANLDQRSFHRNYEVNVLASSPTFGEQVNEMFEEDLALSRRISLEEHERRGFMIRLMEWLVAPLSWFL